MRALVNVATGGRYLAMQDRLQKAARELGEKRISHWRGSLPPGSPSHKDVPYAFKAHALRHALLIGFDTLLWVDSSILPVRSLVPLWERIESHGYWFSENLPFGRQDLPCWTCGPWTCDSALAPLKIDRETAFKIPQVIGTAFGLNLKDLRARALLNEFLLLAEEKTAFQGPWTNEAHQASQDPRVLGHRHDQTVLSVLAWRLGMKLTRPPAWIVDGIPKTEETILSIER